MENTVSFQEYLLSKGYLFDPKIIENYLLSIKVKPFVIFTGNSGTGKTKLSQLFAEYISDSTQNSGNNSSLINDNEFLSVKVPVNKSSFENTGWTLSNKYLYDVLPIKESQCDCDMWVDNIHAKAYVRVQMQLEYDKNNEKLKNYFKNLFSQGTSKIVDLKINVGAFKEIYDCKSNNENFIILEQNSNKTAFNERQWFMNNNIFNYLPFKSGYVGCNIVVEDIKSTAKIRLMPRLYFKKNKELQYYLKENEGKKVEVKIKTDNFNFDNFHPIWEKEKDDSTDYKKDPNYKIVPVGANWTENRHVLGFYNVITEEYNETPSYSLIKASKNDISSPYFLILDEMNLSHVERYFADFLSAIESGQPIPLYSNDDENYELDIPDNLLIVGTVNVDETTYMFSPKVLDRANTIEFPTMAAKEYMNSDFKEFDFKNINYLMNPLEDLDVRNMNVYDLKDIFMFINCSEGNLWDVLSNELDLFQSILKKINLILVLELLMKFFVLCLFHGDMKILRKIGKIGRDILMPRSNKKFFQNCTVHKKLLVKLSMNYLMHA